MISTRPADVPVFVLCGGRGTRLGETCQRLPKPMVEVGDRPILLHIMQWYAHFGFRRFVLCTGWRAEVIASFFLDFRAMTDDFTVDMRTGEVSFHQTGARPDWEVTVAHTGPDAMTGARIARAAARHLGEAEHFAVTYGDGLTDVDLGAELEFHLAHGKIGTLLAVNPVSPFGHLEFDRGEITGFVEKPMLRDTWTNGGFFFFRRAFLDYLSTDDACVLEEGPLRRLAAERQLRPFRHQGFWSAMDTMKDRESMHALWESGAAPWRGREAA
ncbi:MAG: sugar phosphate nucleotidyltransferase [Geminicoccaceae bacterium]|nr:sugar phosphate nucleotidyltransferase [Geminicoccaceae bacterium]MCX8099769.1 sugar phosphate nucleotidyltransferase [Geminicoccaceae bacterium]MDW8370941.1 sugar phosphate nucleotidyltransferase [Geminicoccaceae bacterium]